jgi:beta-lactamase regulating signal transducer with metallopeptidase domain
VNSANRSFTALAGIALFLTAYACCALVANGLVPLFTGHEANAGPLTVACLLPVLSFAALLGIGVAVAAQTCRRQAAASRRLTRRVQALSLTQPERLVHAAQASGLAGRVTMIEARGSFSFTYGALVPRVAVSRTLIEDVSDQELRALLEHERYHVRNLDPLKAMLAKALSEAFFLLPALDILRRRYEAGRELAADHCAEQRCGRRPLVGALLKALQSPPWEELEVSAPLGSPELITARVHRLETGRSPKPTSLPASTLAWSVLGLAVFALLAPGSLNITALLEIGLCVGPLLGIGVLAFAWLSSRARLPLGV